MINIENETRGAVLRCFGPLGFVFLVLALSFGSLASNAAPQVLKGNAGMTPCRVTSINAATGVVTAKVNSSGQSFRFLVKDAALRSSLKEGQEIFADSNTQEVFTIKSGTGKGKGTARLGSILTDNYTKMSGGPAGGTNPAGPGTVAGQPKTESAPVAPGGAKAAMNNVASTGNTAAV